MADLRKKHSMPVIAAEVARRHGNNTAEMVLVWYNQFDTCGHFKLDT